jgi:hypothetical protein
MFKDLLFEIECAEEIGYYKLADKLNEKLIRLASSNPNDVIKNINNKFTARDGIQDVRFSDYQQKIMISAESDIENKTKRQINEIAKPFSVSFRYSSFNDRDENDQEELKRRIIEKAIKDYEFAKLIGAFDDDEEPTSEELAEIEKEDLYYLPEYDSEAEFNEPFKRN